MNDEKKWSLQALIDKYVPLHTRAEVWQMSYDYEKQLRDLMWRHHLLAMQHEHLIEEHTKLREETYKKSFAPQLVSMMDFEGASFREPIAMTRSYRIDWQPKLRMGLTVCEWAYRDVKERRLQRQVIVEQMIKAFQAEAEKAIPREMSRIFDQEDRSER